jgi:tripartite-type tricarboxylate transporter receptor subunit TctC
VNTTRFTRLKPPRLLSALAAAALVLSAPMTTKAADDFPSKDLTFVVPVTPGGGFDTISRILAAVMPKHLPHKVNIVVKNIPGGAWNIGVDRIYHAKPDGYTLGIFNIPGNVLNQITGQADYDLKKFTWIGKITGTTYVGAVSPKSGFNGLADMKKAANVKVGTVGLASSAGLGSLISFTEMGIKGTYVPNAGSQQAILAAIRGDVDYVMYPYPSLRKFIVDAHELKPLVVFAPKRIKPLPDVPTIVELGYPELLHTVVLDYIVGATPGIPSSAAEVLRDTFQKTMQDPEFIEKMKGAHRSVDPAGASDTAKLIEGSLASFAKYKDLVLKNQK